MASKSVFSLQGSKGKSVEVRLLQESEEIKEESLTDIKETVKLVSKFITSFNPQVIPTPFKGTDLKMTPDGKFLVFGSTDGRLARFNIEKQKVDLDVEISQDAIEILTLDFSPDNEFVYIGGKTRNIRKYSLSNFKYISKLAGHTADVLMILMLPDGSGLISASADKSVKLWNTHSNPATFVNLIHHEDEVEAIDVTPDGKYLMTGSLDCSFNILENREGGWEKIVNIQDESPIFAVKISNSTNFVVTGDQSGRTIVWRFNTWEKINQFQDSNTIWCIEVSQNEEFIVTGGLSNNITLWDLVKNREKVVLSGHTMQIKSLVLTSDQKSIISLSLDSKIMKWKTPGFEDRTIITNSEAVVELWFSNENGLLYSRTNSNLYEDEATHGLFAYNIINYAKVKEVTFEERCIKMCSKSEDDKLYYVIYSNSGSNDIHISSYDLDTMARREIKDLGPIAVKCFTVSKDNKYLFIGQTFKIITYFLQEPNKDIDLYNSQIYHIGTVKNILCTEDNKYIVSADHIGIIKLIDVELMANTQVRNEVDEITELKSQNITDMKLINKDNVIAISYSKVLIWSIDKRATVKLIKNKAYSKVVSSLDGKFLFFVCGERLEIWDSSNFSYVCFLQYDSFGDLMNQSFHVTPNNRFFAIANYKDIIITRSPTSTDRVFICGNSRTKIDYIRYLSSIIDDSSEKHEPQFDDWIIEPFHLNTLHFYAFYDFDEYLNLSINSQSPFFETKAGFSPLSIALLMDFPNCISAILRKLREVYLENPYIFLSIENSLTELNNSGYEKLHSLYEILLSNTCNENIPKFCANQPSFPVITISDHFLPKKEEFSGVEFEEEGNTIVILQSYVQLPIMSGTAESIEFIQSIEDCRNLRIFDTVLIQTLLKIKWAQVKYVVFFQMLMYMSYLVLLSLYTVNYRNHSFLIAPFGFNCFFFLYEMIYLVTSGWKYFADYWNYTDLIRIIVVFVYTILIWTSVYEDKDWFLALVILISWVRGVAYFRAFKPTRYLINLLITSISDIAAFLLILFYSTVSFAIIFYSIAPETDEFFTYLTGFYDVNLGNSSTGSYDKFHWLFYVIVNILNPIIMVNLLISILGDTYANVKQYEVVNDAIELISLISEAELLMIWNRGIKTKQYIHVCDDYVMPITQADDSIKNKIKALKRRVVKMTESMQSEEKVIHNISHLLNTRNAGISEVIEKFEAKKK